MVAPGVRGRLTGAWLLGTGVPLLGVVTVGVAGILRSDVDAEYLAAAVLFLGLVAMASGVVATMFVAKAISGPVIAVRRGLERIERGELDVSRRGGRRQRSRAAPGRLQPDGRGPARAHAHPRPVRPPGRRGRGGGGADGGHPPGRRGARDRRAVRGHPGLHGNGDEPAADRGRGAAQPLLPCRRRGRRGRGRVRQQVRGRRCAVRVRRARGRATTPLLPHCERQVSWPSAWRATSPRSTSASGCPPASR